MTAAAFILVAAVLASGPWRTYEVYQPRIERHFVVDTHTQKLKYNHDSSLAWFKGRWFCLWNANDPPAEGRPGQLNYVSTSPDGRMWSSPEPAFSSERRSANPIPCEKGTQWQPNLIVVDGELWAVWSQNSRDEHHGCYVSRLTDPDGQWINRRLLWKGDPHASVDGSPWRLFPTQNPVRLRSGRILAPVTMMRIGPPAPDAPANVTSWWARVKRNSVLYTDDGGRTWQVSTGAMQPKRSWAQWEPTVWEEPDGTVMMFARNNDMRAQDQGGAAPDQMLLWSRSADGGVTWSAHQYVPLETVASRMHVLPAGGDRFMMVHNDWPAGRFVSDRCNLALFFTRGGGLDFVAGPGLTGREPVVAYPQMWVRDDAVLISYSQGRAYRSIKVVHVSPLPRPDRYYVFARSNLSPSARPTRSGQVGRAFRFDGYQHIATREVLDLSDEGFSVGAWVKPDGSGVLLDTRSGRPAGGFVWGVSRLELRPFVYLATAEGNITSSLRLTRGRWNDIGLSVNNRTGLVMFYVNGEVHGVTYRPPAPHPLRGTTGHVGAKRMPTSSLPGLTGEVMAMTVYATPEFGLQQHNWLHNALAARAGRQNRSPAARPKAHPVIRLDPIDEAAFEQDFVLPDVGGGVEVGTVDACRVLRLKGSGSAGVDLDQNSRRRGDRVELAFRFRIERGDRHVLCTVGDAREPARVFHDRGEVRLAAGKHEVRCGTVSGDDWTDVNIVTHDGRTAVRVGTSDLVEVHHHPVAMWIYLGEGYRRDAIPSDYRFIIDVGSVRSRVITGDPPVSSRAGLSR